MFGLHGRERSAFLAGNGKARLRRSKGGPGRSKPVNFSKKGQKSFQNGMGGSVIVWTARAGADHVFREIRRRQARALKKQALAD